MTTNNRDYLGVGWKFPPRINARGGFSLSYYEEDVQEAIWIILSTARGERQMLPNFGCGIQDYVFSLDNALTRGQIAHEVRVALTRWEPRIDLLDVTIDSTTEANMLLIHIDYRLRANNALYNMVYPFFLKEGV